MFTYIYNWKFYRFLKSGMLLDYFFKKIIYYKLYVLFYTFNIQFSEKYFIEYNFLVLNKYRLVFKNLIDYFNTTLIINALVVIISFIFIFLLFLNF